MLGIRQIAPRVHRGRMRVQNATPTQPKPKQEEQGMFSEYGISVTHALPIIGAPVILNPESSVYHAFDEEFRTKTAYISDIGTSISDQTSVLKEIKRGSEYRRWNVKIKIERYGIQSVQLKDLLPIDGRGLDVEYVEFRGGRTHSLQSDFEERTDNYVIRDGRTVRKRIMYDDTYRKNLLRDL